METKGGGMGGERDTDAENKWGGIGRVGETDIRV
jgi:hypothetical protein